MTDILFAVFIASFLIQIFYFFIFSRIIFYKEKDQKEEIRGVSVIIAAHNERKNLEKLIPLLLAQNYPDYEIILTDDRSTDGTYDFISTFLNKNVKVIRIEETPEDFNPKKYALTKAIELAKNEVILMTDADCFPVSSNWIQEMQSGFSGGHEIVLGYSPYEKTGGFLNLFIRYETFYTGIQYLSMALVNQAYMGVGRNLAYLKMVFTENKGFNKHNAVTGGDDDLFIGQVAAKRKVGVKLSFNSKVISIPKRDFKGFLRQKTRHLAAGKKYTLANMLKSGLLPLSHAILYFSLILLIYLGCDISTVLAIFILRTLLLIAIFALISRKLGETIKWLWFPILDLSYLLNYLIVGISAIFSKNIKWT